MTYRVIQRFVDLQDKNHKYEVGDTFPRLNLKVSDSRIRELASDKNRRGLPLIEAVEEPAVKEVKRSTAGKRKRKNTNADNA